MAKGLKVGEHVTVRETYRFKRSSETYQQGLKSVKAGQVGEVIGNAEGRSTIVDFQGKRAIISTQRLERVQKESLVEASPSKRAASMASVQEHSVGSDKLGASEQANPQFVTYIANRLIMTDHANPDADTVVEIRLSDLPAPVQQQIQALIRAKLDLGPESSSAQSALRGRDRAKQAKGAPTSKREKKSGRESKN